MSANGGNAALGGTSSAGGGASGATSAGGAQTSGGMGASGTAGASGALGASGTAGAGGASGASGAAGASGASGTSSAAGSGSGPPVSLDLTGTITQVHDPDIIEENGKFYLFSTGQGVQVRTSTDLRAWTAAGQVFASKPAWITTTAPSDPNALWAPEVAYFGGKYHLYYAASSFGSQSSCIGHATRTSLASGSWTDSGAATICSTTADNWNAIDPHPFLDEAGHGWLALGSFWTGLKLIRLDDNGNRDGPDFFSLATRNNTAVEAAFIVFRAGYYYLFESVDYCCKGVNSTYKIMVGRSASVTGPYLDQTGTPLLSGGGTLVLSSGTRWIGPGHNAILHTYGRDYNVYHSYDANSGGTPTLRISEMDWSSDGWPISAGP
jgi:arabinan endo-1,5-alpha-L-arabinosidase